MLLFINKNELLDARLGGSYQLVSLSFFLLRLNHNPHPLYLCVVIYNENKHHYKKKKIERCEEQIIKIKSIFKNAEITNIHKQFFLYPGFLTFQFSKLKTVTY